jgi:hypothetical protein
MESNDATLPTGRLRVVFRFWPMGSDARHGLWCTLTTEAKGRFHYAAATVTVAVSDTLTDRLSGNHCRRPTFSRLAALKPPTTRLLLYLQNHRQPELVHL